MEYSLSFRDILAIIKQGGKKVLLIAIAFVVVSGLVLVLKESHNNVTGGGFDGNSNREATSAYQKWTASKERIVKSNTKELLDAYALSVTSPLMALDAYDCTYSKIILEFDEDTGLVGANGINAWLVEEYGDPISEDPKYLTDAIVDSNEVVITVWDTEGYDLEQAAADVEKFIIDMASDNDMPVAKVINTSGQGYDERLFEIKDEQRSNIVTLQEQLITYDNAEVIGAPTPMGAGSNKPMGMKRILLVVIASIIGGLIIGAAFVVFQSVRKGIVYSQMQVERSFQLDSLGTFDPNNQSELEMLCAMTETASENDRVLIINNTDSMSCETIVAALNELSNLSNKFKSCSLSDASEIKKIADSDQVILSVRLGKTSLGDIQKSIQWANRFKRDILGYIIINE